MDLPVDKSARTFEHDTRTNLVRWTFGFPWWLAILGVVGLYITHLVRSTDLYSNIFRALTDGIAMTLAVSFIAYASAIFFGLLIGLIRANPPKPLTRRVSIVYVIRLVIYNIATLYVQVLRGLPILVTLLIVAFVIVPEINRFFETVLGFELRLRGSAPASAILALAITYAAFESETFRAGIESIGRGQMEAARSLGMTYGQAMRYVILPQAIRRILPPLGNDLIAMIKDSSLVAILGIQDITQLAKLSSSSSFRYLETYLLAASIYLLMTVLGSLIVRAIERRYTVDHR